MEQDPIEPELVDGAESGTSGGPRTWSFRTVGSPWALFGVMGALGALGALGIAAVLAFSVGWVFLLALVYRWLWGVAFSAELTRTVYGADAMSYGQALATVAVVLLLGWLVSPKKSS